MNTLKAFKLSRLFDKTAWAYFGWSYSLIYVVLVLLYTLGYAMNEEVPWTAGLVGYVLLFIWLLCEICYPGHIYTLYGEKFGQKVRIYIYKINDEKRRIIIDMGHRVHQWDCLGYKVIKEHGRNRRFVLWSDKEALLYDPDRIGNGIPELHLGKRLLQGVYLRKKDLVKQVVLIGDNDVHFLNCDTFYTGQKVLVLGSGAETLDTVVTCDNGVYKAYSLQRGLTEKEMNVCLEDRTIILLENKEICVLQPQKDDTYAVTDRRYTLLARAGKLAFYYDEKTHDAVISVYDDEKKSFQEAHRGGLKSIDFDNLEIHCDNGKKFKA